MDDGGWLTTYIRCIPARIKNAAWPAHQIRSDCPQIYTESSQDGGKNIPFNIFGLLRISRWCMDGGSGGQFATDKFMQKIYEKV